MSRTCEAALVARVQRKDLPGFLDSAGIRDGITENESSLETSQSRLRRD